MLQKSTKCILELQYNQKLATHVRKTSKRSFLVVGTSWFSRYESEKEMAQGKKDLSVQNWNERLFQECSTLSALLAVVHCKIEHATVQTTVAATVTATTCFCHSLSAHLFLACNGRWRSGALCWCSRLRQRKVRTTLWRKRRFWCSLFLELSMWIGKVGKNIMR